MMLNVAINTWQEAYSDCGRAQLKKKVSCLKKEIKKITMLTERKKRVLKALHSAMEVYGVDLDAIMGTKCRERKLVDLRSIAWTMFSTSWVFRSVRIRITGSWQSGSIRTSMSTGFFMLCFRLRAVSE